MSILGGLVTARVIGTRIRALVQGNGQRAKVSMGLGKRVVRGAGVFCVLLGFLGVFATHPVLAGDTHFRYGHYFWKQADSDTIEITIQNAWRRNGYSCVDPVTLSSTPCSPGDGLPQVGDIIAEFIGFTRFEWGDGTAPVGSPLGPLLYLVTSIDPDDNWLFGVALDPTSLPAVDTTLSHTYAAPGDYTAFTDSCCRISAVAGINEHINNPVGGYRVETTINVGTVNNSPVSALPPIVRCPIDALCTFVVPGTDPDDDVLSFRLSASAEASSVGAFIQPGPPDAPNAASIDAATGLYTWDTTGATLAGNPANNTLYSTQVTIEDPTAKVALDFLIQLVEQDPNPPVIEPPVGAPPVCETTQVATVGLTKTFDVTAIDPDAADIVTLNVAALPVGAIMTPTLPVAGNPVSSTFSWTPDSDDVGTHVVSFVANSTGGGSVLCPVTIEVAEATSLIYVASGDSVPAGSDISGLAENKENAYPQFVADYLGVNPLAFDAACRLALGEGTFNIAKSGDDTTDYIDQQLAKIIACNPDIVTVTIGADVLLVPVIGCVRESVDRIPGFLRIAARRVLPGGILTAGIASAQGCLIGTFDSIELFLGIIDDGIMSISTSLAAMTSSDLLFTTYYNPIGVDGVSGFLLGNALEDFVGAFNSFIALRVAEIGAGAALVDIKPAFIGHEVGSECSYIVPLRDFANLGLPLGVHPNVIGQQVIASLVLRSARENGFVAGISRPFVSCVIPEVGAAGSEVVIHGADLDPNEELPKVLFGEEQAEVISISPDSLEILVMAPPQSQSDIVVDVTVENADGAVALLPEGFRYD